MKKLCIAGLVIASMLAFAAAGFAGTTYISMGTGGVGGVYYAVGGALASVMNMKMDGVNCSVEATGASIANINLVKQGDTQLGMSAANILYNAAHGEGAFEGEPVEEVKAILSLYPEAVQIVTLANSGIKTVGDLKGKKVAVGDFGSGTEVMARALLELYGITYDDISEDFLGFSEAATGLKDRTIDAAFIWAGVPTSAIMDLAALNEVALVEIESDKIEILIETMPYCNEMVIPAGTYRGMKEDTNTVAIPAILFGSADLPEDFVYEMLKVFFENTDMIGRAHARGKDITLETALDGMLGIPLHPGAERFYREKGLLE
jgi:hypothetical protein